MLRCCLVVLLGILSCGAAQAAAPGPAALERFTSPETSSLRSIAGWLRQHGKEGYVGADVADKMGIPREET